MKVAITGCSGFVGFNLMEALVEAGVGRYDVYGVDLRYPIEPIRPVTIVKGDLLNRDFLEKFFIQYGPFDTIIHASAQARVEPSLVDPITTYRANVETTINLLEWAMKQKTRIVILSSEAIYGKADRYPSKENDNFRPTNPYASSKIAADVLSSQVDGRGTCVVVVRSAMGYGPRSPTSQVVTKWICRCMDDKPLMFPKDSFLHRVKHPTRDINFIGSFVKGIMQILEHPNVSGVFNLGSGREVDMLTLAEMIVETVGKGGIKKDTAFKYRPFEEGMRTYLDISKAKAAFGYNPTITLEEGLSRTYSWLQNPGRELYGW